MMKEFFRQAMHIMLGSACIALFYFLPKESAIISLFLILFLGGLVSYAHMHIKALPFIKEIISFAQRKEESQAAGIAALNFALAGLLTAIIFYPLEVKITLGALAVLTFGDGFSTIIGKAFGKTKLAAGRSLEGTVAGIAAACVALSFFFPLQIAVPVAVVGMVAEFLPINDNYSVPMAAGIILAILA